MRNMLTKLTISTSEGFLLVLPYDCTVSGCYLSYLTPLKLVWAFISTLPHQGGISITCRTDAQLMFCVFCIMEISDSKTAQNIPSGINKHIVPRSKTLKSCFYCPVLMFDENVIMKLSICECFALLLSHDRIIA